MIIKDAIDFIFRPLKAYKRGASDVGKAVMEKQEQQYNEMNKAINTLDESMRHQDNLNTTIIEGLGQQQTVIKIIIVALVVIGGISIWSLFSNSSPNLLVASSTTVDSTDTESSSAEKNNVVVSSPSATSVAGFVPATSSISTADPTMAPTLAPTQVPTPIPTEVPTPLPTEVSDLEAFGVASGTSGNLNWSLSDDGTLTFSGNGEIPDCLNSTPSYIDGSYESGVEIKHLILESGVTSIGAESFRDNAALQTIEFCDTVTSINNAVFTNCPSLESVTIPENVTYIGYNVFTYDTHLESLTILNPQCEIAGTIDSCPKLTIYGHGGSTAETIAEESHLPFSSID